MKISKTHKRFAAHLDNQTALKYPERFLGPNWKDVLNFWLYLYTWSAEDTEIVFNRYWDLGVCGPLKGLTWRTAKDTIGIEYASVAWDVPFTIGSSYATLELIGSHNLESLTFLPLFL